MAISLGKDAKLYRSSTFTGGDAWLLVENVRDLTLSLEAGEADVTTRGNGGWRATMATLKDGSIEFEMVWDTKDTDFTAIRNRFINNSPIAFAVSLGNIEEVGTEGFAALFMVTNFTRNEPLEEAITVSVSMKPTYSDRPPAWFSVVP
jgi:predicted secreted protein